MSRCPDLEFLLAVGVGAPTADTVSGPEPEQRVLKSRFKLDEFCANDREFAPAGRVGARHNGWAGGGLAAQRFVV